MIGKFMHKCGFSRTFATDDTDGLGVVLFGGWGDGVKMSDGILINGDAVISIVGQWGHLLGLDCQRGI